MRHVAVAYKAKDPSVATGEWRSAEAARSDALDAMNDYTTSLLGDEWTTLASFNFDGSVYPTGFKRREGFVTPSDVIDGLRFDSKRRELVRAWRAERGKQIANDLARLGFAHPLVGGLGGVVMATDGRSSYFTGWSFHAFGADLYATLSVPKLEDRSQTEALTSGWSEVPLSEFHAAHEAAEATA